MANTISTLLRLDVNQFKTGMRSAQQSIKETDGLVNKAKTGWASMWASFTSSPTAMVAAGAAVTAFTAKAIGDASNLEESINAVNVAYGESAEGVHALGEASAESFGLSQRAFNEFSVQFSSFADKIANQSGREVVDVLKEMTTRTADFASVNNLDMAEAARIMQSSLAGETEAIRRYGGDLSAAAVEQFAFENGLIQTKDELTESIKVQARYGLLLEETAKTAGDFANTSGGLANQQRILSANVEDLSASFGKKLTPIVADAAETVNNLISSYDELVKRAPGGKGGPVGGFVSGLVSPLTALGGAMDAVNRATGALDDALGGAADTAKADSVALDTLTADAKRFADAERESIGVITTGNESRRDKARADWGVKDAADAAAEADAEKAEADEKAAGAAERHVEILESQREVTEALADQEQRRIDLVNQSLGGAIRLSQAQRDARDSLWKYNETVKESNEAAPEHKLNQDQMNDLVEEAALSQLNVAEATAQSRIEQAEMAGATVSAADEQRILVEELYKLVGTLEGPVRDAVAQALVDLDALAQPRTIKIGTEFAFANSVGGRAGDFLAPEVGGQFGLNGAAGSRTIVNNFYVTELDPQKVVDAIRKYDRFNPR